jgi:hypothetical protein
MPRLVTGYETNAVTDALVTSPLALVKERGEIALSVTCTEHADPGQGMPKPKIECRGLNIRLRLATDQPTEARYVLEELWMTIQLWLPNHWFGTVLGLQ